MNIVLFDVLSGKELWRIDEFERLTNIGHLEKSQFSDDKIIYSFSKGYAIEVNISNGSWIMPRTRRKYKLTDSKFVNATPELSFPVLNDPSIVGVYYPDDRQKVKNDGCGVLFFVLFILMLVLVFNLVKSCLW
jgi:hypothetical protein